MTFVFLVTKYSSLISIHSRMNPELLPFKYIKYAHTDRKNIPICNESVYIFPYSCK